MNPSLTAKMMRQSVHVQSPGAHSVELDSGRGWDTSVSPSFSMNSSRDVGDWAARMRSRVSSLKKKMDRQGEQLQNLQSSIGAGGGDYCTPQHHRGGGGHAAPTPPPFHLPGLGDASGPLQMDDLMVGSGGRNNRGGGTGGGKGVLEGERGAAGKSNESWSYARAIQCIENYAKMLQNASSSGSTAQRMTSSAMYSRQNGQEARQDMSASLHAPPLGSSAQSNLQALYEEAVAAVAEYQAQMAAMTRSHRHHHHHHHHPIDASSSTHSATPQIAVQQLNSNINNINNNINNNNNNNNNNNADANRDWQVMPVGSQIASEHQHNRHPQASAAHANIGAKGSISTPAPPPDLGGGQAAAQQQKVAPSGVPVHVSAATRRLLPQEHANAPGRHGAAGAFSLPPNLTGASGGSEHFKKVEGEVEIFSEPTKPIMDEAGGDLADVLSAIRAGHVSQQELEARGSANMLIKLEQERAERERIAAEHARVADEARQLREEKERMAKALEEQKQAIAELVAQREKKMSGGSADKSLSQDRGVTELAKLAQLAEDDDNNTHANNCKAPVVRDKSSSADEEGREGGDAPRSEDGKQPLLKQTWVDMQELQASAIGQAGPSKGGGGGGGKGNRQRDDGGEGKEESERKLREEKMALESQMQAMQGQLKAAQEEVKQQQAALQAQYQEQLLDYQRQLEQQRSHSLQQQQQYTLPLQSQQQGHPPGVGVAIGQVLAHAIVNSPERHDHVNWDPSLPVVHQLPPATNAIQGQLNTLLQENIQSASPGHNGASPPPGPPQALSQKQQAPSPPLPKNFNLASAAVGNTDAGRGDDLPPPKVANDDLPPPPPRPADATPGKVADKAKSLLSKAEEAQHVHVAKKTDANVVEEVQKLAKEEHDKEEHDEIERVRKLRSRGFKGFQGFDDTSD